MRYEESIINKKILRGLTEMGFDEMTPIQEMAIPPLMEGLDVIGQAQTGTGKTAAFGIPMIERIDPKIETVQGLVLCPTRELAVQAAEELRKMAKYTSGVKVVPIYGGQDIERQIKLLKGRTAIIVGTPGRVMDHMRRKTLKLGYLKMLVLDEADEMLNMGFREDIETICQSIPEERQTALFSATMPKEILEIADQYQKDPKMIQVGKEELTIPLVKQAYYIVKGREKDTSLCRLVDFLAPQRALIFCNTKRKVDQLTILLKSKGHQAEALHGDLSQHQRDRVMGMFKDGMLELLIATDVAARGIDVDDVDIVFNYDMPQDMEYYVHRIGRTGRAGKNGRAYSLITNTEKYKIKSLEGFCRTVIGQKEMPTAESARSAKAYGTLDEALEFCKDMDLTEYMRIVYKRCTSQKLDPLEAAAALLRTSLGQVEEIPEEKPGKQGGKGGSGNVGRNRKSRDGKQSENRERSKKNKKNDRSGHRGMGKQPSGRKGSRGSKKQGTKDGKFQK